eukprot:jgi/Chrpa1/27713/Chrysochromulina_OHIO_Genome00001956-RA
MAVQSMRSEFRSRNSMRAILILLVIEWASAYEPRATLWRLAIRQEHEWWNAYVYEFNAHEGTQGLDITHSQDICTKPGHETSNSGAHAFEASLLTWWWTCLDEVGGWVRFNLAAPAADDQYGVSLGNTTKAFHVQYFAFHVQLMLAALASGLVGIISVGLSRMSPTGETTGLKRCGDVLQRIYEELGGAEWHINNHWMSGPTCDVPHQNAWYGTHCSTGAIYSLELRGNNLHGTLPTQLGALPNLWALRLESNPLLSGTVPTEIGALQNLKILDLGNNTISGSLPEELLLLTELVFLDTQGNAFSGTLPSLRPWPNVMHLNMADNSISGSLPRFEMLQDLSYMSMHSNRFSGSIPTHVALLTNLRDRLHFHSNRLSGTLPTQLGSLTQLSLPALYHNSIGGHLPTELARLKPLCHTIGSAAQRRKN